MGGERGGGAAPPLAPVCRLDRRPGRPRHQPWNPATATATRPRPPAHAPPPPLFHCARLHSLVRLSLLLLSLSPFEARRVEVCGAGDGVCTLWRAIPSASLRAGGGAEGAGGVHGPAVEATARP